MVNKVCFLLKFTEKEVPTVSKKIAIVSGAGRGIGKAIAKELVSQGIHVVINDIDEELAKTAAENIGSTVSYKVCDVSDYNKVSNLVREVIQEFGSIDIIINNAGISPKKGGKKVPLHKMEPTEWQKVININLNGTFNLSRAAAEYMIKQKYGRIINMSSIAAKSYISLSGGHYSASKAGIIGLTKSLAGELGEYGITVNAIAPGRIETEMMAEADINTNKYVLSQIATRRYGKAEEVANLVSFLVSDKASYITGAVINVDGGWVMA